MQPSPKKHAAKYKSNTAQVVNPNSSTGLMGKNRYSLYEKKKAIFGNNLTVLFGTGTGDGIIATRELLENRIGRIVQSTAQVR